jgi:hypothetical protein
MTILPELLLFAELLSKRRLLLPGMHLLLFWLLLQLAALSLLLLELQLPLALLLLLLLLLSGLHSLLFA